MGCGNGWTEVGINPLVATLFPRDKTHYLNVLHAWWPGGLIIGGLLAVAIRSYLFPGSGTEIVAGLEHWQFTMLLIVIPALVYGFMLIGSIFPVTERVESGVSNADMLKEALRPMFLLLGLLYVADGGHGTRPAEVAELGHYQAPPRCPAPSSSSTPRA